jgi:hypothetical protein
MATQTIPTADQSPAASKRLLEPEEAFWQRYSPHHEFPLSTVASLTLFGAAIGLLFLFWILHGFSLDNEGNGPVGVDAADIAGGGGTDGPGEPANVPGDGVGRTEAVPNASASQVAKVTPPEPTSRLTEDIRPNPLDPVLPAEEQPPELQKLFGEVQAKASQTEKDLAKKAQANKAAAQKQGMVGKPGGSVKNPGAGGGTGGGIGTGVGKDVGPGRGGRPGQLGGAGRPLTRQEIYAQRWRFDLSGDGPEHANKLVAVGVTLIVAAPGGQFYAIRDLKKRPVDLVPPDASRLRDEVKWYNRDQNSLRNLAATLGLRFQPNFVIMLLPKDREEKMAALEYAEFERRGLDERQVAATWFDFRLTNGTYEPFVVKIEQK